MASYTEYQYAAGLGLAKGVKGVNIADIDSGFDLNHEDLQGRYDVADSFNWGDGNSNIQAGIEDHGVSTSGVMIANTNNGIGLSGICWQNVLCIGEKIQSETGTAGSLTLAAVLSAYADIHLKVKTAHIASVNMERYGFPRAIPRFQVTHRLLLSNNWLRTG